MGTAPKKNRIVNRFKTFCGERALKSARGIGSTIQLCRPFRCGFVPAAASPIFNGGADGLFQKMSKKAPSKKYSFHSLCVIFPVMPDAELSELANDIKENGLREPNVLLDGKILDGRNRYLACQKASVTPKFKTFKGDA